MSFNSLLRNAKERLRYVLPPSGPVFRLARRIYKSALSFSAARRMRSLEGLRRFVSENPDLSDIVPDHGRGGCVVEFKTGNKFWWRDPADPHALLTIIVTGIPKQYEAEESDLFRKIVRPGDTVLDIGANFGWHTITLGKAVGSQGRVFAFEPLRRTWEELVENVKVNFPGSLHVRPERLALSDRDGEAEMGVDPELGSAFGTLHAGAGPTERVRTSTLDGFLAKENISSVDFVKCDVEGAEREVLAGSARLLESPAPPVWIIEVNEDGSKDILDMFRRRDYGIYYLERHRVDRAARLLPLAFPPVRPLPDFNFVCVPPGRRERIEYLV